MHRIKNVLVNGIHRKSGLFTERGDFIRKRGKGYIAFVNVNEHYHTKHIL